MAKTYLPLDWLQASLGRRALEDLDAYPEHAQLLTSHGPHNLLEAVYEQGLVINMAHELVGEQAMALSQGMIQWHPYADTWVPYTAGQIPALDRTRGWKAKRQLTRIARSHLPESILNRKKFGAPAPLRRWLRVDGPLAPIVDRIREQNSFVARFLGNQRSIDETVESFWQRPTDSAAEVLWVLINLQRWSEIFQVEIGTEGAFGK